MILEEMKNNVEKFNELDKNLDDAMVEFEVGIYYLAQMLVYSGKLISWSFRVMDTDHQVDFENDPQICRCTLPVPFYLLKLV